MSLIDKTVRVKRGGSFLTIPATAVERYKDKGYEVVDANGEVIKKDEDQALKIAQKKIRELESQVTELKQALREAQNPIETAKPAKRSTKK